MVNIVTVNVSQELAPLPSALQRSGAFISQGATILPPGDLLLLTQASDISAYMRGALSLTSITQTAGLATATAAAAHGFTIGDVIWLTIAGASPAAYNGTFACTVTTTTAFTYAIASGTTSPSTGTKTYTNEDVAELTAMVNTFFAQGSSQAVWVLELGADSPTDGVAYLDTWIDENPGTFYSYLFPRTWDSVAAVLAFLAGFESTTSKTYFFITTTLQNYGNYTSLMKCAIVMIESPALGIHARNVLTAQSYSAGYISYTTTTAHGILPGEWFQVAGSTPSGYNGWKLAVVGTTGSTIVAANGSDPGASSVLGAVLASSYANDAIPLTEFSLAAAFWVSLHYDPSPVNRVAPYGLSYLFGVTIFPTQNNASLLATLKAANINVVGDGSAGGISNALLVGGNTMDGQPFNYWYSVDWVQINAALNVTNAVINGSNDPANPLYLDQQGINTLQSVLARTMTSAAAFGLALGAVVQTQLTGDELSRALSARTYAGSILINAVPFSNYYALAPSDYPIGKYAGFTIVYTPQRGFQEIVINVVVTDFVAAAA